MLNKGMLYKKFGRSDCRVSILGFGVMRLPVLDGDDARIDEERATRLIHSAIDHGINYFDTAYVYHGGNSESFLGRSLQGDHGKKVHLATKLPSWEVEKPEDPDRLLNEQLRRLQTDQIDFYLLHALNEKYWKKLEKLGVLEFLDRAIEDGRIKYAGFSFHDGLKVFKEIIDAYDWTFCQIQYNYIDEDFQAGREGLRYAASRGLGIAIMEPLRGGNLTRQGSDDIQALWNTAEVARSPAEWALRWVWDHPEVSVVLSGMNDVAQISENCRIAAQVAANSLTTTELELVKKVRDRYSERIKVPCTACFYCMPCPNEVNIPEIFDLYNNIFVYGDREEQQLSYTAFLPEDERATNCIECGDCEEACPQQIKIMEMLKESHDALMKSS